MIFHGESAGARQRSTGCARNNISVQCRFRVRAHHKQAVHRPHFCSKPATMSVEVEAVGGNHRQPVERSGTGAEKKTRKCSRMYEPAPSRSALANTFIPLF